MGGSSGGTSKTTQTSSPWSGQTPYLKYGMDEAARLYQKEGPQYYPGSTVAGFSQEQKDAFGLGTQRAMNGSASMQNAEGFSNNVLGGGFGGDAGAKNFANASMYGAFGGDAGAKGYATDVLGGKYLNSDPYQDSVFQNVQQKVMPTVNSQFMGAGRYGSNLHADTATRALTESYAPYASQQYQSGLDRMGQAAGMADSMYNNAYGRMASGAGMATDMYNTDVANRFGAAGMAPTFAANDWTDINALSNIGGQQQQLGQQELNDAAARWDYYQQLPYNKLGQYQNNIGGNYGGTTVGKTQTPQPSMFSQVAGAGLGLLGSGLSGGMFNNAFGGSQGFY
jgi:hypothetical protein